jgi:HTH-type transcriptional regulator / antitoxin HigA
MNIKPIKNERDYEGALRRVEALWDSPKSSPESDEVDVLATLIEAYERERYPVDMPDPVEAIEFRLEQEGKDERALIGVIGGRSRVHEVLRRKRPLSIQMIRALHAKFGIPANVLIQPDRKRRVSTRRNGSRRAIRGSAKASV